LQRRKNQSSRLPIYRGSSSLCDEDVQYRFSIDGRFRGFPCLLLPFATDPEVLGTGPTIQYFSTFASAPLQGSPHLLGAYSLLEAPSLRFSTLTRIGHYNFTASEEHMYCRCHPPLSKVNSPPPYLTCNSARLHRISTSRHKALATMPTPRDPAVILQSLELQSLDTDSLFSALTAVEQVARSILSLVMS